MNALVAWGRRHPTRVVALLALVIPAVAAYLPAPFGALLGPALTIIIGKPLHDRVTPVASPARLDDDA